MAEEFDIEQLEAAGVAFGMAAQLVGVEPDEDWIRACRDDGLLAEAPFGMDDEGVRAGLSLMEGWALSLDCGDLDEAVAGLRREWLRLFIGVGSPDAPVWESYYIEANSPMMSRATIEVRARYRKHGVSLTRQGSEPDDSLAPMLAFCAHVQQREVDALRRGDGAFASECRGDLDSFIAEHLLPWMAAWRYLVEENATSDYYRGVGLLVFGLLRCYARRFGIVWDGGRERFVRRGE